MATTRLGILLGLGIMKPILSVAVPAHNEEERIARCVESVVVAARQAAQPVEVVVALNRCTDRTRDIAESLGARCVVEDKKCIAAVRNAAVRASTAPAVATLDADSWMSPNTISEILAPRILPTPRSRQDAQGM